MPLGYSVGHQTAAGTNLSIITLGEATVKGRIHQMIVGSDSTPADIATEFAMLRFTTQPAAGTALVEKANDPGFAAATLVARGGTLTEPTYEAVGTDALMELALNQRATFTWIANPGYEFVTVLGVTSGIGLRSIISGGTPNINATLWWNE